MDYDELLYHLRGELNDFRRGLVNQAFQKLDRTGDGRVDINDIRGLYNGKNHPDVRIGKKTEDEILCEFLDTFEAHHGIVCPNDRDHIVTLEEFVEYYKHVSASIEDDRYFELMIRNAWNFDNRTYQAGWAADLTRPPQRARPF